MLRSRNCTTMWSFRTRIWKCTLLLSLMRCWTRSSASSNSRIDWWRWPMTMKLESSLRWSTVQQSFCNVTRKTCLTLTWSKRDASVFKTPRCSIWKQASQRLSSWPKSWLCWRGWKSIQNLRTFADARRSISTSRAYSKSFSTCCPTASNSHTMALT